MTDVFRTPDERFANLEGYDFEPQYVDLSADLDGLRLHYLDEGTGDPILLMHGEPTWAYLYRKMIPSLAKGNRVVAPDFIGFGRSDKVTDIGWYTYDRHCASVVQLIEALDLKDITIVVQDWGGPIGLRVATEHADRFARLVVLNTGVFRPGPGWPTPGFMAWRNWAEQNPDMPIGFVVQGATSTDLSEAVVAGYEAPFPDAASKAGAAAFPLLVPLAEEDPGAKEMGQVRAALETWEKPALVAFSDSDPIFSQRAGERLAERIPGAVDFVLVPGAAHFLQEDKGEEIATHITDFLSSQP
ncbi:MAG TPA: haloalkane dehalogenase [Actinomycetota bacterium]|nr:haloalkane dehalogenase [Actinomycetota bacterium]